MDKGVFTIGSITSEAVCQAVDLAVTMHQNGDDACDVPAYVDTNVSTKVIKLIQSYVGIINKMIWRKTRRFIRQYRWSVSLTFDTS